jgi:purine-binding chemotaxis protein CheW
MTSTSTTISAVVRFVICDPAPASWLEARGTGPGPLDRITGAARRSRGTTGRVGPGAIPLCARSFSADRTRASWTFRDRGNPYTKRFDGRYVNTTVVAAHAAMLVTRVGGWACAFPIEHVVEIMRPLPVEPIGRSTDPASALLDGLAVIRGAAVPVIDARRLLGVPGAGATRFVVVRAAGRMLALAVDAVIEVARVAPEILGQRPPLLSVAGHSWVAAIATRDASLLVVLDAARLLSEDTWRATEPADGAPETARELTRQADRPVDPEVPRQVDPEVDRRADRPVDPEVPRQADPEAERAIDPEADRPVDPEVAQEIGPEAAREVDP